MSLLLSAIARATDNGHRTADRLEVREELFSGRRIRGAVGTFHIDRDGDTSLRSFAIYRAVGGRLVFRERAG